MFYSQMSQAITLQFERPPLGADQQKPGEQRSAGAGTLNKILQATKGGNTEGNPLEKRRHAPAVTSFLQQAWNGWSEAPSTSE